MREKHRPFNFILSSTLLVLYRKPKCFEKLFPIPVICSFKVRCSSINTLFCSFYSFYSFYLLDCLFHELYGRMYPLFRDNVFTLNHLKTLFGFKLAVWKVSFMFLCEKKRFVSSASIMGSNTLDINYININ